MAYTLETFYPQYDPISVPASEFALIKGALINQSHYLREVDEQTLSLRPYPSHELIREVAEKTITNARGERIVMDFEDTIHVVSGLIRQANSLGRSAEDNRNTIYGLKASYDERLRRRLAHRLLEKCMRDKSGTANRLEDC